MDAREKRGLEIATTKPVKAKGNGLWLVPSQNGQGAYLVDFQNTACSCPDFEERGGPCKHLWATQHTMMRQIQVDLGNGLSVTETQTVTVRRTYRQDWSAYNAAQCEEKASVAEFLHALCAGLPEPEKAKGRPRHRLADVIFACAMKVYLGSSGRRAVSDFKDLAARGFMSKPVSFNSVFDYLDDARLTPVLKALVEESANPLKAVETNFAVDASGFSTSVFDRWYDEKYGAHEPGKARRKFVKCHLMTGVRTHVVTSCEVTDGHANDCPYLPGLVDATARRGFTMNEVSADKGYLSNANLEAIEATGAAAYVPFKLNSQGVTGSETWKRLFHAFSMERGKFLARYHQRSNVETVFSMIHARFGKSLRSRHDTAQKNEVLLKVLLHNLACLVMAAHEIGLSPSFWTDAKGGAA